MYMYIYIYICIYIYKRRDPLKVRSQIRCMLSCETLNLKIYVYTDTCIHMYIYRCMYINILPQGLLLPLTRCVV